MNCIYKDNFGECREDGGSIRSNKCPGPTSVKCCVTKFSCIDPLKDWCVEFGEYTDFQAMSDVCGSSLMSVPVERKSCKARGYSMAISPPIPYNVYLQGPSIGDFMISSSMADTIPDYKQCDKRWACHSFRSSSGGCSETKCNPSARKWRDRYANVLCSSGCGPTSLAMIISAHGTTVTPKDTGDWMMERGYRNGGVADAPHGATCRGSSHVALSALAKNYGLSIKWHAQGCQKPGYYVGQGWTSAYENTLKEALVKGPVLLHVRERSGNCKFTNGGHYAVVTKYHNGIYSINDPGSHKDGRKTATATELFSDCAVAGFAEFTKN